MPNYEYRCSRGHVTAQFRKLADFVESIRCHCKRKAHLFLSKPPRKTDPQRIWTATEVHGKKKASSETFAHDLEEACMSGRGLQR